MDLNHHSGLIGLPLLGLPAQWADKTGNHRLLSYGLNAHGSLSPPSNQYSTTQRRKMANLVHLSFSLLLAPADKLARQTLSHVPKWLSG